MVLYNAAVAFNLDANITVSVPRRKQPLWEECSKAVDGELSVLSGTGQGLAFVLDFA